ncbi:hypothetical protein [Salipiger abyssi]|uniref:hypothetical protein n=1 Tax=Salipiger abyssi TaxID=1250539 RepID=UPI0009783C11|nr:hypothetical protein [Salipiger abyssi]
MRLAAIMAATCLAIPAAAQDLDPCNALLRNADTLSQAMAALAAISEVCTSEESGACDAYAKNPVTVDPGQMAMDAVLVTLLYSKACEE